MEGVGGRVSTMLFSVVTRNMMIPPPTMPLPTTPPTMRLMLAVRTIPRLEYESVGGSGRKREGKEKKGDETL